jgi:hypothetical protein
METNIETNALVAEVAEKLEEVAEVTEAANTLVVELAEALAPLVEEAPKKVRKSPTSVKVTCIKCGKEAFSQSFKVTVGEGGVRVYECRKKGGCSVPAQAEVASTEGQESK